MPENKFQSLLSETALQFAQLAPRLLPDTAPADLEKLGNSLQTLLKKQLDSHIGSLDVVTKEEFAAHTRLLNRLKDRIVELEQRLQKIEQDN